MSSSSQFIILTCQLGAETVLKKEMERRHPEFRFSYSRPGFLTYKLPEDWQHTAISRSMNRTLSPKNKDSLKNNVSLQTPVLPDELGINAGSLRTVFARSVTLSWGKISAENSKSFPKESAEKKVKNEKKKNSKNFNSGDFLSDNLKKTLQNALSLDVLKQLAVQFWERVFQQIETEFGGYVPFVRLHVWQRDYDVPGNENFEPEITPLAQMVRRQLWMTLEENYPDKQQLFVWDTPSKEDSSPIQKTVWNPSHLYWETTANPGEVCLDCLILDPEEWWIGLHQVSDFHSQYPGGIIDLPMADDAVSRAWLKFEEGIRWSGFPITFGSSCADIGSAPGGGSQALLARGAYVLGIDPAKMDDSVYFHPNFTHLRGKISQIRQNSFRKTHWIITDMNVAPTYTLDALEELVSKAGRSVRGLVFTLKLFNWNLADGIPDYIRRIKRWGFDQVKVRQLQFNRQEIMIAARRRHF